MDSPFRGKRACNRVYVPSIVCVFRHSDTYHIRRRAVRLCRNLYNCAQQAGPIVVYVLR